MSVRSLRYNTIEQHFPKGRTASTDRDALAFLEAAQIYNTNQQRAIVNLVRSLKRVGLWSKMKAIYPFVGGTASAHKWNLKDPRDVDAAFRLTFSGGWTHSANGADPNGTNGYADTFITPNVALLQNSTHASYYSRQDTSNTGVVIGCENSTSAVNAILIQPDFSGITYTIINGNIVPNNFISFADTNGASFYIASRNSATQHAAYKNGTLQASQNANSTGLANTKIVLGAYIRSSIVQFYTDKECAFATIGDGLTDTDATNLYNIVDLYQKRLGRAV